VATDKFEIIPRYPYRAVQWQGDKSVIVDFLDTLPLMVSGGVLKGPHISIDYRGTLCISGYKCSGLSDYVEVPSNNWLVLAFSDIDAGFRLMAVCCEEFEGSFEAKPGPVERFSTAGVKLQYGGNYD